MSAFIPDPAFKIPSADILTQPKKERDRTYKVVKGFYCENPNVTAEPGDILYLNKGDNNFYLEKKKTGKTHPSWNADRKEKEYQYTISYVVDWSLGLKATRYGWVELVNVENQKAQP